MTDDPLADKLARFTPAAALDRDEMLFRAGRASARTPRGWKFAVAGLIVSNAVTLALWATRPEPVPPAAPVPAPPAADPEPPVSPHPSSYLALSRNWDAAAPPPASPGGRPADPPLTAGSRGPLY